MFPDESTVTLAGLESSASVGGLAVAAVAVGTIARDRIDHSIRDLANHVIEAVGDEEVPGGVERDGSRVVERGVGGRPAIAGVAVGAISRDRRDRAGGGIQPLG